MLCAVLVEFLLGWHLSSQKTLIILYKTQESEKCKKEGKKDMKGKKKVIVFHLLVLVLCILILSL